MVSPEASLLVYGQLPSDYVFSQPFLIAFAPGTHTHGVHSSFYKDASQTGLGPHLYDLINLIISFKALSPNTVTLGVGDSTCDFGSLQRRLDNSVHDDSV